MEQLTLNKAQYKEISNLIESHNDKTHNGVDFEDILYSFFNNEVFNDDDGNFKIYNDWDEGEANDPFWDKERNNHSAICFIMDMCLTILS